MGKKGNKEKSVLIGFGSAGPTSPALIIKMKPTQIIFCYANGSYKGYNMNAFNKRFREEFQERFPLITKVVELKDVCTQAGIDYLS